MKTTLKLGCIDELQIINKMQMMEAKYKAVKLDFGRTGEGLTEDTLEYKTWEGELYNTAFLNIFFSIILYSNDWVWNGSGLVKAKCHYYFVLDAVMKTRVNITPPYEINSGEPVVIDIRGLEHDPIADEEDIDRELERQLFSQIEEPPTGEKKFPKTSKAEVENKKVMKKLEKGSGSSIGEAIKLQAQITGQHYEQEIECRKLEISANTERLGIEKDRLRLESEREDMKLKLEEKKLEQAFDLEKMKMEREKEKELNQIAVLKLQIELEMVKKNK